MFCKYCGRIIKDNVTFCPFCGRKLADSVLNSKNIRVKKETSEASVCNSNNNSFRVEKMDNSKLNDIGTDSKADSSATVSTYNYKRIILVTILICSVILIVKTIVGNTTGNALVGTWRLSTISSSYGSKSYSSYDYRIVFYKSGTFNDIDHFLEEDFYSDGDINSWKVESSSTLVLKDMYNSTYIIKYNVFLGTLILKYDGQTYTYRRLIL